MSTQRVDPAKMANELAGASAFFRPAAPTPAPAVTPVADSPAPAATSLVPTPEIKLHSDVPTSPRHDVMTS